MSTSRDRYQRHTYSSSRDRRRDEHAAQDYRDAVRSSDRSRVRAIRNAEDRREASDYANGRTRSDYYGHREEGD